MAQPCDIMFTEIKINLVQNIKWNTIYTNKADFR